VKITNREAHNYAVFPRILVPTLHDAHQFPTNVFSTILDLYSDQINVRPRISLEGSDGE